MLAVALAPGAAGLVAALMLLGCSEGTTNNKVPDAPQEADAPADVLQSPDAGAEHDTIAFATADTPPDAGAETAGDAACVAGCTTPPCGPDGCDGECGGCRGQEVCEDGRCVCKPRHCVKDACGPDGCGGSCGDCPEGSICGWPQGHCQPVVSGCEPTGFCRVPAGAFTMGSDKWDSLMVYDKKFGPAHPVVLTRSFEIQATEVTQAQWMEVMQTDVNPSQFPSCGPDCPVSRVPFFSVVEFANRLSELYGHEPCYELVGCQDADEPGHGLVCEGVTFFGADCEGFRLPSEAEWEYAARGGTTTDFPNGDAKDINHTCLLEEPVAEIGWFCGNNAVEYEGCLDCTHFEFPGAPCCGVHPVAQKAPNALGLYDMSGNLYEFTGSAWRSEYSAAIEFDPGYDAWLDFSVSVRGGSYNSSSVLCTVVARIPIGLEYRHVAAGIVGFRMARTLPTE